MSRIERALDRITGWTVRRPGLVVVAFLVVVYYGLEGYASVGVVNLVPIFASVAALAGSMRALGLPFNALTATILSITIGLGTDYSAHVVHRFADEYDGTNLYAARGARSGVLA